jgi:hypothetical protein
MKKEKRKKHLDDKEMISNKDALQEKIRTKMISGEFNLQQDGQHKLFQHPQFSVDQLLEKQDNLHHLEKHF